MTNKYKLVDVDKLEKILSEVKIDSFAGEPYIANLYAPIRKLLEAAPPADVEPVASKIWLWKNGDHYLAYTNEYPCESQGGDPLTLGEPVGYAILKESFSRDTQPQADKDAERIEQLEDCLDKIRSWCKAYPTTIFTEPNWDEVQEKLGKNLLCQVSGSNMRHVTTGIQKIIDETMGKAMGEV